MSYTCNDTTPLITGLWKAPTGPGGPLTPIGHSDPVRIVTNDFMVTGGDGCTALTGGTNVQQPGGALLDIVIDFVAADSPVVEGRITRH